MLSNTVMPRCRNINFVKGRIPMRRKNFGCGAVLKAWFVAMAALTMLALPNGSAFAQSSDLKVSGTVTIDQVQVAFIFSGNLGSGKLHYQGKTYEFDIGGLGVGGFGVSKIEATGTIYNLSKLTDFAGVYGQARTGIVVADMSAGTLWLENRKGVYMKLKAKREGIALSLGVDGIYIAFD
jgi:hypothetical protein